MHVTAADDCFAFLERGLLHEEAIALLRRLVVPVVEKETMSVFDATGRICAKSAKAPRAISAHTRAAVDGYSFAFADYDANEGALFPIAGRAAAGKPLQRPMAERGAVRIFTGATMPKGCDTVAMQEIAALKTTLPSLFLSA